MLLCCYCVFSNINQVITMLIVTPVNADKDAIASIKIDKTKLSVSCFIANLKGF